MQTIIRGSASAGHSPKLPPRMAANINDEDTNPQYNTVTAGTKNLSVKIAVTIGENRAINTSSSEFSELRDTKDLEKVKLATDTVLNIVNQHSNGVRFKIISRKIGDRRLARRSLIHLVYCGRVKVRFESYGDRTIARFYAEAL